MKLYVRMCAIVNLYLLRVNWGNKIDIEESDLFFKADGILSPGLPVSLGYFSSPFAHC